MLTLFRGDDMAFAEFDRKVCVRFNTCQDLTGWAAKFCLYDNIKQTADISSRIWTFGYTSTETQVFPLGKTFGRLLVVDPTGQVRQISKVEVEVVNQKLEPCIAGFIAISVDNVLADYNNMGNKPVLNGKVIEGIQDSAYYGLADAAKVTELEEKVDSIVDQGAQIEELSTRLTTEISARESADTELIQNLNAEKEAREESDESLSEGISAEATIRANADNELASQIIAERQAREDAIVALTDGTTHISKLLFVAEGDPDNFYRIQVVMRDDGGGGMLPVLALDAVPRDDSSSDESSGS